MVYKWCIVPQCTNTSIKTPQKLFVSVPKNPKRRNKWLQLARRDPNSILSHTNVFMCEDHFDLPNDMDNYMQYHVMGNVSQVRMKPDCVPKKFSCQSDAKTQLSGTKDRSLIFGKGKKMIVEKYNEEPSSEETESCCTDSEMSADEDKPSGRTGVVHIIDKFKVKSVNQIYKSILIYQDLDTGFCFLRPLMKRSHVEIVAELHKIFLSYVPARNVDVHSCTRDMVDAIQEHMDSLCPMFKITFTKRNTGSNDFALQVASKLSAWMSKTNRDEWELGCSVVQREINMEGEPGNTPHCKLWRGLQAHRHTDRADTQASGVAGTLASGVAGTLASGVADTLASGMADTQASGVADTQTSETEYFVKQEMDIGPETIEGLPCLKVDASQVEVKVERDDDDEDTYS